MSEDGDEYGNERSFYMVDYLSNADVLVRTEYGSLMSESLLREEVLLQLKRTLDRLSKGQRLHIRMEVLNREP